MQGIDIPLFFDRVSINSLSNVLELEKEYLDCPGILLEIIDSFTLSELADHAPRETWQKVCDEAI